METLLFVCTGNLCRSPMAAGFAHAELSRRPYDVEVISAGLLGAGLPAPPKAIAAMRPYDVSLVAHRSRPLTGILGPSVDLVVGMAREHARAAVEADPGRWLARTFTLKDLARRSAEFGPRAPGESLARYLARIGEARWPSDLLGSSPLDDVADPIGGGRRAFRLCAEEISGLVATVVDALWPA